MNESGRWDQIQQLFMKALDLEEDQRMVFLKTSCEGDDALLSELTAMLEAHEYGEGLILEDHLLFDETVSFPGPEDLIGKHVGPYRIIETVGQGGMGAVYLADRDDGQYSQQVALKLIRPGLHTSEIITRFRTERQILAHLGHPNIARLLDGGVTNEGFPYLVMEYVNGEPLTKYCDERQLSIRERLQLFQVVCQTVQFAHRNLVVHRDLKPNNILVTEDGVVKLLDFGIAKLLDPDVAGGSIAKTRVSLRMMTPEYAAPEQVRGETITTATDVYALGVLLYELLSGHRPYQLPNRWQAEVERIICEEEPTRPSTVIVEVAERPSDDGTTETITPERISSERNTLLSRLRKSLQGDLDNIVMMTLRKEPERRYASAEQVSEDITRYLNGNPVIAQKDTFGYRFSKFAQRNRIAIGVAGLFLALLIAFISLTLIQAQRVAKERDLAQREAVKAEEVTSFLMSLFESADPLLARRDTISIGEFLEAGAERVDALADQPEVQGQVLNVMSEAFWSLGRPDRAEVYEEKELEVKRSFWGNEHLETAKSMEALGVLRQEHENFEAARALYEEALTVRRTILGENHPEVAILVYRLGLMLHISGRSELADSLFAQSQNMFHQLPDSDNPEMALILSQLGNFLMYKGELEDAERFMRKSLDTKRRLFGEGDFRVADDVNVLTSVLMRQKRFEEAEANAREALALHRELFPEAHSSLALSIEKLGRTLFTQNKFEDAEPYMVEGLEMYRTVHGDDHTLVAHANVSLAQLYHQWGRYDDAETFYKKGIAIYEEQFGSSYPITVDRRAYLANLFIDRGDYSDAEKILLQDYNLLLEQRGPEYRYTIRMKERLGKLYDAWGKPALAEQYASSR